MTERKFYIVRKPSGELLVAQVDGDQQVDEQVLLSHEVGTEALLAMGGPWDVFPERECCAPAWDAYIHRAEVPPISDCPRCTGLRCFHIGFEAANLLHDSEKRLSRPAERGVTLPRAIARAIPDEHVGGIDDAVAWLVEREQVETAFGLLEELRVDANGGVTLRLDGEADEVDRSDLTDALKAERRFRKKKGRGEHR